LVITKIYVNEYNRSDNATITNQIEDTNMFCQQFLTK